MFEKSPFLMKIIGQNWKVTLFKMKTPLPKFPHHRGVPEHHFGVKTPLLATLKVSQLWAIDCFKKNSYLNCHEIGQKTLLLPRFLLFMNFKCYFVITPKFFECLHFEIIKSVYFKPVDSTLTALFLNNSDFRLVCYT